MKTDAASAGIETSAQRDSDIRFARCWLGLAVGSLLTAGVLAILLVVGRAPPFVHWVTDPLFFKRCLVVHVDLALVVWFYAFLGCLVYLLPARRTWRLLEGAGLSLSAGGLLLLLLSVPIDGVQPVLSNYVPVLDHPLFLAGLAAFGGGLVLSFLSGRLLPGREGPQGVLPALPDAARPGLRAAAIAFLLAALTFGAGVLATPSALAAQARYELAFWGGGHVLQFASSAAMVTVWLLLVRAATGADAVGRPLAAALFGLLVAPLLVAPLLTLPGTDTSVCREGFTTLMRWGIFPAVSVFLLLCLRALARAPRDAWRHPAAMGFLVSACLAVLGFVLGALIRGPNTMVPAHYHASIGAVTAAFMAGTYLLLEPLGMALPVGRLGRAAGWQPALFGVGQMVFAVGFGAAGSARKAYGAEQTIRSLQEWIGLTVMGVGGLVAAAGGILFLLIVVTAASRRLQCGAQRRRSEWANLSPSTQSRG